MYGIVNQAIQSLILDKFGQEKWQEVKELSNLDIDTFLSIESYDDRITYEMAGAAATALNISLSEVLVAFGEYWILKTGQEHYGHMLKMGGRNLKEFLINLPSFHSHVMLMYPDLTPPEFKVSNLSENGLHIHYYSQRPGLTEFVRGLLQGLAKMFEVEIKLDLLECRDDGYDHDVFQVQIK